ncbi:hypothetical protein PO124_09215 [Bacillus licheniformis]|nr:hypothetical protein [Bacillus licheniformis]
MSAVDEHDMITTEALRKRRATGIRSSAAARFPNSSTKCSR